MSSSKANFSMVKLGEIAEFRNGVNYDKDSFGRGIKVINVKDFKSNSIATFDRLDEIVPDGVVKPEHHLRPNDILFVRSNGNRELIGRSLFVREISEPVTYSAFSIRVRFTDSRAIPRYFAYVFRTSMIREELSAHGGGTNISNLNQGILSSLRVPLPECAVQERIVRELQNYDDLIENNRRRITLLRGMASTFYREWFVHFRFPGYELSRSIDTPLGRIPAGWEVKAIGDEVEVIGGGTPSTKESAYWDNGQIAWYSPTDLTASASMFIDDSEKHITEDGLANSSARLFPPNSVMLTSRATIGVVGINTTPATTNQGFIVCLPSKRLSAQHIYWWMLDNIEMFHAHATGSTFKELGRTVFRRFPVVVPDEMLAGAFSELLNPISMMILNLQRRNTHLARTRDWLLPKLISGEIDVCSLDGADAVALVVDAEPILKIEPKPEATVKREAPDPFKEAVLIAAIVRAHTSPKYPTVARFRRTKIRYLVHRKAEHDVRIRFQKQAAGPYDSASRYKGPEAIALKNKYVEERKTEYGPAFAVGKAVNEIDKYLPKYGLSDALDWVMKNFKFKKNPELELLTTVDYAALDLISRGEEVSCASIRDLIASEPKWLPKLDKQIFSDIGIESALQELQQHFGKYE